MGKEIDGISSVFEPAKALVRGLPLPDHRPSKAGKDSYDLSRESAQVGPRFWPSRGIQLEGVTSDRLVAEGESASRDWVVLPISVIVTSTTRGCAQIGRPASASIMRGTLSKPGPELPDHHMWCP